MRNIFILLGLFAIVLFSSCRKSNYLLPEEKQIITDNGEGTGTVTWTKDMDILLNGFVFVNEGQELTIEKGAVVRFTAGTGPSASALIVARGGKIYIEGTESEPVIFTAEEDNLNGSITKDTCGLWGGLIVLGNAPINTLTGEAFVEGIPNSEPRGLFGGNEKEDNSGSIEYLSIRFPGTVLYEGNEINGLTLGGVGSETKINHVEIINSADDGLELFGGTVNFSNVVVLNPKDDVIDYDFGYKGNGQFVLGIHQSTGAGSFIEGGSGEILSNISSPKFANFTMIGKTQASQDYPIKLVQNAGGYIVNSIFNYSDSSIAIEYLNGSVDAYSNCKKGDLKIENNVYFGINPAASMFELVGSSIPQDANQWIESYYQQGSNSEKDLGLVLKGEQSVFLPQASTDDNLFSVEELGLTFSNYKGAISLNDWTVGWTVFREYIR